MDSKANKKVATTVQGDSAAELRNHWKNWYPEDEGPPLNLMYHDHPDAAIITIKSFNGGRYAQYNQDYQKLLDQYFNEIKLKEVENLIIDIRGNEGGSESVKTLFSYLKGNQFTPNEDNKNWYDKIKPAKTTFDGRVIVLTNQNSISAQETFVSIFRYYQRGLTLGSSTAGCFKGLCGGKKYNLVLPNSKFRISIPRHQTNYINSSSANYQEGEGYPPDMKIQIKIDDLVEDKDVVMEFALAQFKKNP